MSGDANHANGVVTTAGPRPNQTHPSQLHSSQSMPGQQWDYRKLSNRMTPTIIRTEAAPPIMNGNNLTAAPLQTSPSTMSPAESSPRDPVSAHEAYGHSMQNATQQAAVMQYSHHFGQGQPRQQISMMPQQPQEVATISPSSQSYHSPLEQHQQLLYEQLGYQEPAVSVVPAAGQQFAGLQYPYGVTATGADMFKPEDYGFTMLVQSNEHLMPSQRVMNY
ncbi:MAG: hypothetical protein Q9227_000889 [Pyrenula ochraceoflavens]